MTRWAGGIPDRRAIILTAEYVAAQWKKAGLVPAGENGTWFQAVPFVRERLDEKGTMTAGSIVLKAGTDFVPGVLDPQPVAQFRRDPDDLWWRCARQHALDHRGPGEGQGRRAQRRQRERPQLRSHVRADLTAALERARPQWSWHSSTCSIAEVRRDQVRGVLDRGHAAARRPCPRSSSSRPTPPTGSSAPRSAA